MANCYIDFICQQQGITRHDDNVVAEGAANVLYARFHLCPKWDGLRLYAHFKHMAAEYDVPIEDGCACVPWEVIKYTGFEVSIFGEDAEGGRLTSAKVFVEVKRGIDYDGAQPIPATPTLLQRLEADVAASAQAAATAAAKVEAAEDAAARTAASAAETAASVAKTEEWELTMEDGSIIKKVVCVR